MRAVRILVVLTLTLGLLPVRAAQQAPAPAAARYFPPAGTWEARNPGQLGFDQAKLDEAVAFAISREATTPKDLAQAIPAQFRSEAPYNNLLGPTSPRTGANGVIIRKGYVAARWGDTDRADMTFSVTKTFLSTVAGEAVERGLIKSITDRATTYMPPGVDLFRSAHNAPITWEHLLRQTSDWSGTLWDKPDWADRPQNCLGPGVAVANIEQCKDRPLLEPGSVYKYNDTRVNVLALALLYLFKEPLPAVLKREVMDPIGASASWHWEPYSNAYATIEGKRMPSVPGGGHHGGGMFISAWDMARFGYLFLNQGKWHDKPLVSESWIGLAKSPGPANTQYGFMNWFLNTPDAVVNGAPARQMYPAVPASVVAFRGNGENIIYIDWDNDLVVVVRWIGNGAGEFFGKVVGAIARTGSQN
jgi:CubicO group peptidase (beta-lactamase class C family)